MFFFLCLCVSVDRASVGPAVKQSNSQASGLRSQTYERLPYCAARGESIHGGTDHSLTAHVHTMYFICKITDHCGLW